MGIFSKFGSIFAKSAGYNLVTRWADNRPSVERKSEDGLMSGVKRLEVIASNRDDLRNTAFSPATALQLRLNTIGTIGGRLTVVDADGRVNKEATTTFRRWAKHCEFTRGDSLNELLGELLTILTHNGGDFIAVFDDGCLTGVVNPTFRVKIFEADQILNIEDKVFAERFGDGYTQTHGIVRDRFGRVCAAFVGGSIVGREYFAEGEYITLKLPVPGDFESGNWVHVAACERPNMARGIASVTHLADNLRDLEVMKDCEVASAKANAALGLIFSETDPNTAVDASPYGEAPDNLTPSQAAALAALESASENAALKQASVSLSAGKSAVVKLRPNTKLDLVDSKRPNVRTLEFYDRLHVTCGAVLGLPSMYTDLKPQGSYSGARAEMALARPTFEAWQKFMERHLLDWLAARVAAAYGLNIDDCGLIWSWPELDALDEGAHESALQKAFLNGEKNLVDIHGADTEAFLDRRKTETEMYHARGLTAPWEVTVAGAVIENSNTKED